MGGRVLPFAFCVKFGGAMAYEVNKVNCTGDAHLGVSNIFAHWCNAINTISEFET